MKPKKKTYTKGDKSYTYFDAKKRVPGIALSTWRNRASRWQSDPKYTDEQLFSPVVRGRVRGARTGSDRLNEEWGFDVRAEARRVGLSPQVLLKRLAKVKRGIYPLELALYPGRITKDVRMEYGVVGGWEGCTAHEDRGNWGDLEPCGSQKNVERLQNIKAIPMPTAGDRAVAGVSLGGTVIGVCNNSQRRY